MIRTQDEIVADLRRRADILDASAKDQTIKHTQRDRVTLKVAAHILRVAAEQNSFSYPEPAERAGRAMVDPEAFKKAERL